MFLVLIFFFLTQNVAYILSFTLQYVLETAPHQSVYKDVPHSPLVLIVYVCCSLITTHLRLDL